MGNALNLAVFKPPSPPSYYMTSDLVHMRTSEGNHIVGRFFMRNAKTTILYSHGNAEDIGILTPALYQKCLALNVNIFMYEYSGYGRSTGSPSETNVYADIKAALCYLENIGIEACSVVLMGRSLGSGPSVELASKTKVKGLILQSPMTSIHRVKVNTPVSLPGDMFVNIDKIDQVKCEVLVIHGLLDAIIPPSHAEELLAKITKKRRHVCWLPSAGHNDIEYHHSGAANRSIQEFLLNLDREPNVVGAPIRASEGACSDIGRKMSCGKRIHTRLKISFEAKRRVQRGGVAVKNESSVEEKTDVVPSRHPKSRHLLPHSFSHEKKYISSVEQIVKVVDCLPKREEKEEVVVRTEDNQSEAVRIIGKKSADYYAGAPPNTPVKPRNPYGYKRLSAGTASSTMTVSDVSTAASASSPSAEANSSPSRSLFVRPRSYTRSIVKKTAKASNTYFTQEFHARRIDKCTVSAPTTPTSCLSVKGLPVRVLPARKLAAKSLTPRSHTIANSLEKRNSTAQAVPQLKTDKIFQARSLQVRNIISRAKSPQNVSKNLGQFSAPTKKSSILRNSAPPPSSEIAYTPPAESRLSPRCPRVGSEAKQRAEYNRMSQKWGNNTLSIEHKIGYSNLAPNNLKDNKISTRGTKARIIVLKNQLPNIIQSDDRLRETHAQTFQQLHQQHKYAVSRQVCQPHNTQLIHQALIAKSAKA